MRTDTCLLFNAANGIILANYEYAAFGELIRATGPMAKVNPVGWSDKIGDPETGLTYYGYRYYNPSNGRFLNRDPFDEKGGLNLYANVGNNEVNFIDPDGRGFIDCVKALADLARAQANVEIRIAEIAIDINHTGLDYEHAKALSQALTQMNEAYRKVAQYCGCTAAGALALATAAAVMQAASQLLQELQQIPVPP